MPDRVKPSFVIINIRALLRSGMSVRVPGCQKLQMTATVCIKGLNGLRWAVVDWDKQSRRHVYASTIQSWCIAVDGMATSTELDRPLLMTSWGGR